MVGITASSTDSTHQHIELNLALFQHVIRLFKQIPVRIHCVAKFYADTTHLYACKNTVCNTTRKRPQHYTQKYTLKHMTRFRVIFPVHSTVI